MDDELEYVVENIVEVEQMNWLTTINLNPNQMIHDDDDDLNYFSFEIVMDQSKSIKEKRKTIFTQVEFSIYSIYR